MIGTPLYHGQKSLDWPPREVFFGRFYGKLILCCVTCVMHNTPEAGVNGLTRGGSGFLWQARWTLAE